MSYLGGFNPDDTGASRSLARNMAAAPPPAPAPKPEPMASNPLSAPSNAAPIRPTSYEPVRSVQPVRQAESSSYVPMRPTEPIGSYAANRPLAPPPPPAIRAPEPVSTYTPSYSTAAPQGASQYSNPLSAPEGRSYAERTAPAPTNSVGFQIPNGGQSGEAIRQDAQQSWQRMNTPIVGQNGELTANGAAGSFANSLGNWTAPQRMSDPTNYGQNIQAGTPEHSRSLQNLGNLLNDARARRPGYQAQVAAYSGALQDSGRRGLSTRSTISGDPRRVGSGQTSFTNDDVVDLQLRRAEEDQSFGRGY